MRMIRFKILFLGVTQAILLVSYQVCLKLTTRSFDEFSFSRQVLVESVLKNHFFWLAIVLLIINIILWLYILKSYEFSRAYPLISLSYVFGILASIFIFNETVPFHRWIGVLFIIAGVCIVTRE